jgi:hypothetical protein
MDVVVPDKNYLFEYKNSTPSLVPLKLREGAAGMQKFYVSSSPDKTGAN